jgi:5-methylcytosine-specific restriction endonuclease McrA
MSRPYRPDETPLFLQLWQSQNGLCALCGEDMPRQRSDVVHATLWAKLRPTFDHIRPRSKGGQDKPENLQLAHARCNWRKGNRWSGGGQ